MHYISNALSHAIHSNASSTHDLLDGIRNTITSLPMPFSKEREIQNTIEIGVMVLLTVACALIVFPGMKASVAMERRREFFREAERLGLNPREHRFILEIDPRHENHPVVQKIRICEQIISNSYRYFCVRIPS